VVAVSTATGTNVGALRVRTYTVDSDPAPESVTVTVSGPGLICTTVCGKSLKVIGTGGDTTFTVQADGTAGTASIVVATTTKTFAAKTVSFYAKSAATLVPTVRIPVLKVGDNVGAVSVAGTDSTGALWPGQAYIVASSAADAAIAGSTTPVACAAYNSTDGIRCPITATTAGTAKFKIIDASTVATATATSAEFSVTASASQPGSFKIAFDKATYGPGEKATIIVTPLDIDGKALPANDIVNALTSTGITSTVGFTSGSDSSSLAVTTISPSAASSAVTGAIAGSQVFTVYMPFASGDVKVSATGSTGFAAAGRVTVSATASVVNSSVDAATDAANEATDAANAATDAALAAADAADAATAAAQDASDAVAALSASVSKMIASLKAQITSLTNLVIKIQKKVRA